MNSDDFTLLIGVGAQRSGTTWVSEYFSSHKDVLMSGMKELHYFDAKYQPDRFSLFNDTSRIVLFRELDLARENGFSKESYARAVAGLCRAGMMEDESLYMRSLSILRKSEKVVCEITPSYAMLDEAEFRHMAAIHHDVKILFLMRTLE